MHVDWFIVLVLAIGAVFTGWSIWLAGEGKDEQRPADREEAEKRASH